MESREKEAKQIVEKYAWWSAGAGLFPLPGVDVVLIGGTNVLMLRELSALYGVEFSATRGRALVSALVAGSVPPVLAGVAGFSRFLKFVPVVGQLLAPFGTSVFAAATTYAVGQVFIRHYESGGTLLDFNPARMRAYFREQFARGKETADREMKPSHA